MNFYSLSIGDNHFDVEKVWCDKIIPEDCKDGQFCGVGVVSQFSFSNTKDFESFMSKMPSAGIIVFLIGDDVRIPLRMSKSEGYPDRNFKHSFKVKVTAYLTPDIFPEKSPTNKPW